MTIFDESNIDQLAADRANFQYAQLYGQEELKAKYQRDQLRPSDWKHSHALIGDRRWIHALKLGLLTEDEFYHGEQGPDVEVRPSEVIPAPQLDESHHETLAPSSPDPELEESIEEEEIAADKKENTEELVEEDAILIAGLFDQEQGQIEEEAMLLEEATEHVAEEDGRDEVIDEVDDIEEDDADTAEDNDEDSKEDIVEEAESSSFVSWLKRLPVTGTYRSLEEDTVTSTATYKDEKAERKATKVKKKKAKKAVKASKKAAKKAKKKQKNEQKQEKKKAEPFEGRLQGSLLLSDSIASETLAELLREHGHADLARKMYKRLSVNNPEKSRYFAAQIDKITEEE